MVTQQSATYTPGPRPPFGLPQFLWFSVFLAVGVAASVWADALFSDTALAATFAACIVLVGALRLYQRSAAGGRPSWSRELALSLARGLGLGATLLICATACWFIGEVASGGRMPEAQLWA